MVISKREIAVDEIAVVDDLFVAMLGIQCINEWAKPGELLQCQANMFCEVRNEELTDLHLWNWVL